MRLTGMGSLDVGSAPPPFGYPARGAEVAAQELMNTSRHRGSISAVRLPFACLFGAWLTCEVHGWHVLQSARAVCNEHWCTIEYEQ
jgi:hypothetical protein